MCIIELVPGIINVQEIVGILAKDFNPKILILELLAKNVKKKDFRVFCQYTYPRNDNLLINNET